jgi:tetratricopeptide (TPR) repeat protein
MDTLVKVIETLSAARPDAAPLASPIGSRRTWRWFGFGAAAAMFLVTGLVWMSLQRVSSAPPPLSTAPSEQVSDERISQAFQMRERGDVDAAIALLSQLLDGSSASPSVRAHALRDRAFCYKLEKNWPGSIGDLSTALALGTRSSDATAMVLKDRADAYLQIPDLDAALADYETLTQLKPDDREGLGNRDVLRAFLRPTQGFLFVFPPPGTFTSAAMLPLAVQKLDQISFLNLRFWWHPIPATQVRYTRAEDEATATTIVLRLRAAGIDGKGPTLLSGTVPRSRRIEVWFTVNAKASSK